MHTHKKPIYAVVDQNGNRLEIFRLKLAAKQFLIKVSKERRYDNLEIINIEYENED